MTGRTDDWEAARYVRHSSLQQAMADEALRVVELHGDERVLDVGCGDGRVTRRLAERLPRGSILGVDASADMVAFARRAHAGVANLAFEAGDARALRHAGEFDAVVSFNALHWVPRIAPALRGIRAALRPGGRAWLRLVTQGEVESLEAVAEAVRRQPPWASRFEGFDDPYLRATPEALRECMARAGLRVASRRTRLAHWDFGTQDAFFGFARAGFGAWTARLPGPERDAFVAAVLARYGGGSVFRYYQSDFALRVAEAEAAEGAGAG